MEKVNEGMLLSMLKIGSDRDLTSQGAVQVGDGGTNL